MNLKQFFYKGYFEHQFGGKTIKLKKPLEKNKWEDIKKENGPIIKSANDKLFKFNSEISQAIGFLNLKNKLSGRDITQFSLKTTYPGLFSGSGYAHETGNTGELSLGFFFDHTTGLPILPGSSVKGTLRSVFPQFSNVEIDSLKPLISEKKIIQVGKAKFIGQIFGIPEKEGHPDFETIHRLELAIFEGVDFVSTRKERNRAKQEGRKDVGRIVCYSPMSNHDIFLDAFISKADRKGLIIGPDAITPHDKNPLKNPIPIPFLKILPDVEFTFQFLLHLSDLDNGLSITAAMKKEAFKEILLTLGVGAKTNVGYGQFTTP